jgi:uncharacterized protein (DUF58 family)
LTPLLRNDVLSRLEHLRINASRRFTDKRRGEHLSGKGGRSIEFSDYRDYAPGDDVRFVDWNVFARLNRPYMKLYHQEEEMHVAILVDASSSMSFEGKLDRAKQLAAAFGLVGLLGRERVSVYSFNSSERAPRRLPPCLGRASMMRLFEFIEKIEAGGDAPVEAGIESFLRYHAGRGAAVVLSDFLTFGDVGRGLNLLFTAGLEIFGVQILGPSEINPDVTGDMRLVDCETQGTLDVTSANELIELYREYCASYERRLAGLCRHRCGRFLSTSSTVAIEWVLFDLFRRQGWLQ